MKKILDVQFELDARLEIAEAYTWYENEKNGLGDSFLKAIERTIGAIQKSPSAFTQIANHRQIPVKKFPFVIVYEVSLNTIFVDAVFHTSRDPKKKL
jgi:hypothetical protein